MAIRSTERDDPILKNRRLTLCSPPEEKINLLKSNLAPISIITDPDANNAKSVNAIWSDCDISLARNTPTSDDPVIHSKDVKSLPICSFCLVSWRVMILAPLKAYYVIVW